MFKSKTLFIIGAGASCEAGLPSGEDLKSRIAKLLNIKFEYGSRQISGDYQITAALRKSVDNGGFPGDINPLLRKAWRISDVVPTAAISIDNFLDAHQGDASMELCGKLSIVKSILDAERASKLRSVKENFDQYDLKNLGNTWYVKFFQMLTENVPKQKVSTVFDNISIITFNYDRCIEHFLVQALSDYYELDISDAENLVKKLPVYHPYGSVGLLPWQGAPLPVPFGAEIADLLLLSKRIKTFTEGLDDKEMIASMHAAVTHAETVVFLGFAFHPSNMKLLAPTVVNTNAKRIFATTYGFSTSDESIVQDEILKMLNKGSYGVYDQGDIEPIMANMMCNDFFKQYFRSLSAEIT